MSMASPTRATSTDTESHVTSPPHLTRGSPGSTSQEEDSAFPADFRLHAQHDARVAGLNMPEPIPLPNAETVGGEAVGQEEESVSTRCPGDPQHHHAF